MDDTGPDPIEGLKENALSSYGENRLDAIETLGTFGEDAIPALVEMTNKSSKQKPQQLAREKIREINTGYSSTSDDNKTSLSTESEEQSTEGNE